VGGRVGEHPFQGLVVAALQLSAPRERAVRAGDASGKGVADPLQLPKPGDPRRRRDGRDRGVDLHPREGLGEEAGQLTLEAPDLTP
jgi:hypothetical protein